VKMDFKALKETWTKVQGITTILILARYQAFPTAFGYLRPS